MLGHLRRAFGAVVEVSSGLRVSQGKAVSESRPVAQMGVVYDKSRG